MGSFSWLKADTLTKIKNIYEGCRFKCLIPAEFGGGYIIDDYQDYGYLGHKEDGSPKYDMYELLAFWNSSMPYSRIFEEDTGGYVKDNLQYDEDKPFPMLKEIDQYTDHNRNIGIDIGCYNDDIDKLKYPLKLVSDSFQGTYEECKGVSYGDPDQGFYPTYRE